MVNRGHLALHAQVLTVPEEWHDQHVHKGAHGDGDLERSPDGPDCERMCPGAPDHRDDEEDKYQLLQ